MRDRKGNFAVATAVAALTLIPAAAQATTYTYNFDNGQVTGSSGAGTPLINSTTRGSDVTVPDDAWSINKIRPPPPRPTAAPIAARATGEPGPHRSLIFGVIWLTTIAATIAYCRTVRTMSQRIWLSMLRLESREIV